MGHHDVDMIAVVVGIRYCILSFRHTRFTVIMVGSMIYYLYQS